MNTDKIVDMLARITNTEIAPEQRITLSSVQQGALAAMARKAGIEIDRKLLKAPVTAAQLAGEGGKAAAAEPERPTRTAGGRQEMPAGAGIGCDIQSITEFRQAIDESDPKSCAYLSTIFSPEEISYCENQPNVVQSLCGMFAAKEAILKASDISDLSEIEITHGRNGKPVCNGFSVSISHSVDYCMAIAMGRPL